MAWLTAAVGLLSLVQSAAAAPAALTSSYAVKERHPVPQGWSAIGDAPKDHTITLQLGLRQQGQTELQQHALEVSDPAHSRYGQYLSASDIHKLIEPSSDTQRLVESWLASHDIRDYTLSPCKSELSFAVPVEKAEQLLNTTYSTFVHTDGDQLIRAPEWSLPEHLHEHIDVVQPTTSFFRMKRQASHLVPSDHGVGWNDFEWWQSHQPPYHPQPPPPGAPVNISAICNATFVTLQCLRTLYGTINYTPKVPQLNSVAVTNYLNETQNRSDISIYLQNFRPEAAGVAYEFPITVVANGQNDQVLDAAQLAAGQDIEGDLDGEVVLGISWPTTFSSWVTGGSPPYTPDLNEPTNTNEPYVTWLTYVLAQEQLPYVISTSYGDDEQTVPLSYADRACTGFSQLAARGISVLFSSGDSGVGPDGACYSNTDPSKELFIPNFPTSCPWVTSVGATGNFQPETATSRFGSGAGFSNYFGRPSYQDSAVEGYLAKIGNLYAGLYNQSGRAYPDVAAQGNHDVIVWDGEVRTVGGTSASSPTFAAVIALVNDALIAAGRPRLGFLNPWLYSKAYRALTDITIGSSIGCNTTGFPAEVGWDAVTGFGTPNFDALVQAAFDSW